MTRRSFRSYQTVLSLGICLLSPGLHSIRAQQQPGEALVQTREAETLIRAGQWDQALNLLAPLEVSHPRDLRLLNLKGLALTGAERKVEANAIFSQCLAINPAFFPALKNLGINEFLLHQSSPAEKHLTAALALSPNDHAASLYLGQLAFQHGNYAQTVSLLARAGDLVLQDPEVTAEFVCAQLEANPADRQVLYQDRVSAPQLSGPLQFAMGSALIHAGRPSEAIEFLEAAKSTDPERRDLEFDLVIAEVGAGQFDNAITESGKIIAAGEESSELDNLMAEAYEGLHRTQDAIDSLRHAIALEPKAEQNYLDFAALCLNHKAYAQGLTVLNVGMQVDPRSERLYFERGILYAAQDQFDEAERDFAHASELAPEKDTGTLGLGVTYLQSGNFTSAVRVVRERLRAKPNDPQLLCLLGEALLKAGAKPGDADFVEAERSLAAAVSADPNLELAHVLLGKIYLQQSKDEQAVEQLERAKELKPSDRAVFSHLVVAYRHLRQPEKMQSALTALRALNAKDRGEAISP